MTGSGSDQTAKWSVSEIEKLAKLIQPFRPTKSFEPTVGLEEKKKSVKKKRKEHSLRASSGRWFVGRKQHSEIG